MRKDWDSYFLKIAQAVSERSTCPRKHVGTVIVRDKMILASGYNGSVRGHPHCDDVGCDLVEDHCVRVVHAEMNAIAQAAKNGVNIDKSILYTTTYPCWPCMRLILNAGIVGVLYGESYKPDPRVVDAHFKSSIYMGKIQ